jgi:hypothetical protein
MSLLARYRQLRPLATMDDRRADEIVQAARPHAAALLPTVPSPAALPVVARRVRPADALGGSLIPAWPIRAEDGSVTIEYVADWGLLLAGWREAAAPSDEASLGPDLDPDLDLDGLLASGDRLWVGIANDVLQKFVPDPPDGTYSMVRHHALMLGAATLWLGADRARLWQRAHTVAARAFLRRLNGGSLWAAVEAAEQGLAALLADPRARSEPEIAVRWLDGDPAAALAYRQFHGAASLGIAALLATAPAEADQTAWLLDLVHHGHPRPELNRDRIEAFFDAFIKASVGASDPR